MALARLSITIGDSSSGAVGPRRTKRGRKEECFLIEIEQIQSEGVLYLLSKNEQQT